MDRERQRRERERERKKRERERKRERKKKEETEKRDDVCACVWAGGYALVLRVHSFVNINQMKERPNLRMTQAKVDAIFLFVLFAARGPRHNTAFALCSREVTKRDEKEHSRAKRHMRIMESGDCKAEQISNTNTHADTQK